MTIRHCKRPGCHHLFRSQRHKIYCSTECGRYVRKRRAHPPRDVQCLVCKRVRRVEGVNRPRLLCSPKCRQVHQAIKFYGIKGIPLAIRVMLDREDCQVCGRIFGDDGKLSKPHIDHDHDTGYFRGIICGNCNLTAGRMPAEDFRKLADYLDRTTPATEMSGYIAITAE